MKKDAWIVGVTINLIMLCYGGVMFEAYYNTGQ